MWYSLLFSNFSFCYWDCIESDFNLVILFVDPMGWRNCRTRRYSKPWMCLETDQALFSIVQRILLYPALSCHRANFRSTFGNNICMFCIPGKISISFAFKSNFSAKIYTHKLVYRTFGFTRRPFVSGRYFATWTDNL